MFGLIQIDWGLFVKTYGAWGVVFVLAVIVGRSLANYIKKQHEEHLSAQEKSAEQHSAALHEQIVEAREERDYSRQLREQEANKFLDSLRLRDEKMERGFDEVVQAIRDTRRK